MAKKKKLPKDANQKAKSIVDLVTSEDKETTVEVDTRTPAQILGSEGGKKGGPARKAALSEERRKEIARIAAAARWGTKKK